MSRRITAVFVVVLMAVGASSAVAAPKKKAKAPAPVCLQLVDESGDGRPGLLNSAPGVPSDDALDIVSGDIASGPHAVVVALRLKSVQRDTLLTGGATYQFSWSAGSLTQAVYLREMQSGDNLATFDPDASSGQINDEVQIPVAVDASTSTITWTVRRSMVAPVAKAKLGSVKLSGLKAATSISINRPGSYSSTGADQAATGSTYTDGVRTCLKGT